jgi:hypothetical protein
MYAYILLFLDTFASFCAFFPVTSGHADCVMLFLFENERPAIVSIARLLAYNTVFMHVTIQLCFRLYVLHSFFYYESALLYTAKGKRNAEIFGPRETTYCTS